MSIKIAYTVEDDTSSNSTRHIAEAVTQNGERLSYRRMVSKDQPTATVAVMVNAYAKRDVLHAIIDDAIHRGLL